MNHLVLLDTRAGELEKILSGTKSMVAKELEPAGYAGQVNPGDSLYFLRNKDDCSIRVKATVIRVLPFISDVDEDLSQILKEMQPRLQLTEDQYNYWSTQKQVLLVEFDRAHKISVIRIAPEMIMDRPDWIACEELRS
jgi:hypothetical protein